MSQAEYLLHLSETVASFRIEDLLNRPGESPEDVPVVVALGLHPASFLEVLNERGLVEVGPVLEPDLVPLLLLRLGECAESIASILVEALIITVGEHV